jgi:hypothetical protein
METSMHYVHFTINVGSREYDLTLPKVKSLDRTVEFLHEQYPEATSMVLSIVFEPDKAVVEA